MASETHAPETITIIAGQSGLPSDAPMENRPRRRLGNWQTSTLDRSAIVVQEPRRDEASLTVEDDVSDARLAPPAARMDPAASAAISMPAKPAEAARPTGHDAIGALIKHVESHPHDVEALTRLANELHGVGMTREAAEIQRRLTALAAQPSVPGPPAPAKKISGPLTVDSSFAARAARARRSTRVLNRGTTELSALQMTFPIEDLGFTEPLPRLDEVSSDARIFIDQSSDELASGQLMAALDSCLMAVDLAPHYVPIQVRIAEIYARQKSARRARAHALDIVRLIDLEEHRGELWMARRVLIHVSDANLDGLKELADSLIEARQLELAIRYANPLIDAYLQLDLRKEALDVATQLSEIEPRDANAALTKVALFARFGETERAIEHWRTVVAAGADERFAKASIAAMISSDHERDHWCLLAESLQGAANPEAAGIASAYRRTAEAMSPTPLHLGGQAILAHVLDESEALTLLQAAMTDPVGTAASRAFAAVAASRRAAGPVLTAALQTSLQHLQTPTPFSDEVWTTLTGVRPALGELEASLGAALLADGDTLGALSELKRAHARDPKNAETCKLLAEAHVQNNQLGAALAVLDSLVINLRNAGKLEAMVETLRKMAALAPDNIRVKSRLIDSYLQRGFVDEAKGELLARANLEERSGRISDAVISLQRSADLSWSLGRHEESFATYQRLIALAPDDAGARSTLVNLYLQLGRIGDAAEHQRAVVDIATRTGSPHEAIAALHQVIGLTPDDSSAYFQLGELLQSMGEHQQAEKVYKRLVLMNPNDHSALEKLAQVIALKQIDAKNLTVPAM